MSSSEEEETKAAHPLRETVFIQMQKQAKALGWSAISRAVGGRLRGSLSHSTAMREEVRIETRSPALRALLEVKNVTLCARSSFVYLRLCM